MKELSAVEQMRNELCSMQVKLILIERCRKVGAARSR